MADRTEIADALESLAVHCRPPLMSVEDKSRWMRDWCDDLKDHDIAAIRLGCAKWRNGDNPKFPLPGQLRAVIKSVERKGDGGSGGIKPWAPVTDAEYQSMSLHDKIRHQEILAMDARGKAGPMWAGGKHIAPEDMPRSFHDACQQASHHAKEAKRLRGFMKQQDQRA